MAKPSGSNNTTTVKEDSLDYVLNFQRSEMKYFVPKERMEVIIPELLQHMKFDDYSATEYYPLYSIYCDTEDFQAFFEKLDGIERRKKFRIRSYYPSPSPDQKVMLEIKEKNKDIILKRRSPIKFKDLERFMQGEKMLKDEPAHDEFRYAMLRNQLKPKILIKYERRAFMPKNHGDWRVTIDRNVEYAMVNSALAFDTPTKPTSWSREYTVLEVKYDKHPPQFVLDIIKKYNLRNEAISKFADSIMTHHTYIKHD